MSTIQNEEFYENSVEYYIEEGYPQSVAEELAELDMHVAPPDYSGADEYEFGR